MGASTEQCFVDVVLLMQGSFLQCPHIEMLIEMLSDIIFPFNPHLLFLQKKIKKTAWK